MRKIILFSVILQLLNHFSRVECLIGTNIIPSEDGEFPFIASLRYYPGRQYFCGGTLISRKHVITAEHCLEGETLHSFRIIFKAVSEQEFYIAASWSTYDDWADRQGIVPPEEHVFNDIAIIELVERVQHVNPAELSVLSKRQLDGTAATLIGLQNGVLSKVTVNLLNDDDCNDSMHVLNDEPIVDNRTLCTTANPYALLENVDAGFPLLSARDNRLLGVSSGHIPIDDFVNGNFPTNFIRQHQVNVHFSVDRYQTFIRSYIRAAPRT